MTEGDSNFIGKDGFNWFVGQVENDGSGHFLSDLAGNLANTAVATLQRTTVLGLFGRTDFDWDWTNKVKVRIVGYHSPSKAELPTEDQRFNKRKCTVVTIIKQMVIRI